MRQKHILRQKLTSLQTDTKKPDLAGTRRAQNFLTLKGKLNMANLTATPPKNQTAAAFAALKPDFGASVLKKMHAWRDKGSYADEGLIIFSTLLAISSLFTLGIGYLLHREFFTPFLGETWATVSAVGFTLFIEGAKIVTALWALWMLVFGVFKRGLPSLLITILGLILSGASFSWSIHNSTVGVQKLVNQLATYKTPPAPFDGAAATAAIDAQIQSLQTTQNAALATKWRGTTTVDAMRTAKSTARTIEELQSQRGLLLHQAMTEHTTRTENRTAFVDGAAFIATTLGGKMEYLQMVLLMAMVFAYRAIWEHIKQTPASDHQPAAAAAAPIMHQVVNGQNPYLNQTERRPIGFFQRTTADTPAVEQRQTVFNTSPTIVLADVQKWKSRATQCHERSLSQKTEQGRADNARRRDLYFQLLGMVGIKSVIREDEGMVIFGKANYLPNEFDQPTAQDAATIAAILREIDQIKLAEPV